MEKPLYIIWTEEDQTGIPIIDEQHRSMISMINSLYYFISRGQGAKFLKPTMKMIEQFTTMHFATEEELMKQSQFPGYEQHVAGHRELLADTQDILYEEATEEDAIMALRFLKKWWMNHMKGADQELVEHYLQYKKANRIGNTV